MKNFLNVLSSAAALLLFATLNNAHAGSPEELCLATYKRDYNEIKTQLKSGVHPDQRCQAKNPSDLRVMNPSPLHILLTGLRAKDMSGKDIIVVDSNDRNIKELAMTMLDAGANPNYISELTKSYKTTNFTAALRGLILTSEAQSIIDRMLELGADIHLSARYSADSFKCENSPVGILTNSKLDAKMKLSYIHKFESLGANECE